MAGQVRDAAWQDLCLFQDQRRDLCVPGAGCWHSNVFSHALDGAGALKDEAGRESDSIKAVEDLTADSLSAANMQPNACGNVPALAKVLPKRYLAHMPMLTDVLGCSGGIDWCRRWQWSSFILFTSCSCYF